MALYRPPDRTKSAFQPWEDVSQEVIAVIREVCLDPSYWKKVSTYYAEENHEVTVTQDDISCVKSICKYATRACSPGLTESCSSNPRGRTFRGP